VAVISYKVDELDCAEEASVLRRSLAHKDGVLDLDFDLLNARMTVAYDPEIIGPDEILAAVRGTAMTAVPWEERTQAEPESLWRRHGRPAMAAASGLLLAAGFASHWALHGDIVDAVTGGAGRPEHVLPLLSLVLYLGAVVTGAWHVAPRAVMAAVRWRPDMHLLMMVAVAGAMAIGEWFEAATVSFLFAVAQMLEHWSVARARRAIGALMDLSPEVARVLGRDSGRILESPVAEVPVGAVIVVRPGEKVPLDGTILTGQTTVNQAPITGESRLVAKGPADQVFAGTINERGTIHFEATRPAGDTTLARIIHLVQESQSRRAPSEQWIEKFARYYTPVMMALALVVVALPPLLAGGQWSEWLYRGLVLLVIACPCALVISTPVSVVSGLTSAMRNGILIKGGMYLEDVGRLRAIAMDKTGTLTYGRPEVQEVVPLDGHTPAELLERAAAIEADSVHPLADAVVRRAIADGVKVRRAKQFRPLKGKGAEGQLDGRHYWIGSHRLMHERGRETPEAHQRAIELEDAGHSAIAVGSEGHVCGLLSVADGVRDGAPEAIRALKRLGVREVLMLTGDNEQTARSVAEVTGVDEYRAGLLPEDKVEAVRELVAEHGRVAMVGDGVNDAPAMAVASMGIAMGAIGSDAAIEAADVTLMSDELPKLPWLIAHSRRTLATTKQNVTFALGLKAAFIVLALLGLATLWMAIAADTGASLLVIFNGLRLLRIGRG